MKKLLIVTQDTVKIQSYSGFIGRSYSKLYLFWLNFRLGLSIFILNKFFKIIILSSREIKSFGQTHLYYDDELSKIDYSVSKKYYWQIINQIFKDLNLSNSVIKTLLDIRIITLLTYNYFVYFDLYDKVIRENQPNTVLVLGNSLHEQIASFVCQRLKINLKKFVFFSFSKIDLWLKLFLLNREYSGKINRFLQQSKNKKPDLKKLNNAILLSLDFFRHLKFLAPVYKKLLANRKNPWFVTDIPNPEQRFKNIGLKQSNFFYIASFLPKISRSQLNEYKKEIKVDLRKLESNKPIDKSSDSFYYRLSLNAVKPLLEKGLLISKLYILAGENLFNCISLKNVIVLSDARFVELSLSSLAKKYKVRSIMASPNPVFDLATLNNYEGTDKLTVVGNHVKERLIKLGVNKNKIFTIGDFRFKDYGQYYQSVNKKLIYLKLGIKDLNKKIILAISFRAKETISKKEKKDFLVACYQTVSSFGNAILVIKPHPTEKFSHLKQELKDWGVSQAIISNNQQIELIDLLYASSVVVETWSMTIFEAILMNRPVISVNLFGKNYHTFLPILNSGGAQEVKSIKELFKWLKIFLNDKALTKQHLQIAQKANELFIRRPDGKAVQRLLSLIS